MKSILIEARFGLSKTASSRNTIFTS